MNERIMILVLLAVIVVVGCQEGTLHFVTYENSEYGIRITHPETWEVEEGEEAILFLSPDDSLSDDFCENLNVVVEELLLDISLDTYVEIGIIPIKKMYENVVIVESSDTTLSNQKAHKLVYTMDAVMNQKQVKTKIMQVMAIKDEKVYLITFTAREDTYEDYLEIAEEMLNSFEIL